MLDGRDGHEDACSDGIDMDGREYGPYIEHPVQGFRSEWVSRLIQNAPKNAWALNGYLSALYVLRMETLPPAYVRSHEVSEIQAGIREAIRHLEDKAVRS